MRKGGKKPAWRNRKQNYNVVSTRIIQIIWGNQSNRPTRVLSCTFMSIKFQFFSSDSTHDLEVIAILSWNQKHDRRIIFKNFLNMLQLNNFMRLKAVIRMFYFSEKVKIIDMYINYSKLWKSWWLRERHAIWPELTPFQKLQYEYFTVCFGTWTSASSFLLIIHSFWLKFSIFWFIDMFRLRQKLDIMDVSNRRF